MTPKIGNKIQVEKSRLPAEIRDDPVATNAYYLIVGYQENIKSFIVLMPSIYSWPIEDSDVVENSVLPKYVGAGGWYIKEHEIISIQNEAGLDNEPEEDCSGLKCL